MLQVNPDPDANGTLTSSYEADIYACSDTCARSTTCLAWTYGVDLGAGSCNPPDPDVGTCTLKLAEPNSQDPPIACKFDARLAGKDPNCFMMVAGYPSILNLDSAPTCPGLPANAFVDLLGILDD